MRFVLLIALVSAMAGPAAAQKVYRCTDAKGQPVFQQSACGPSVADAPKAEASAAVAAASGATARGAKPCHSAREIESVRSAASSPTIAKAEAERLLHRAREMERCQR
jgi:hypothetical protein